MATMQEAVAAVEVFPAAARAANATSGGIDAWNVHGRARSLALLLSVGAVSGGDTTLDVRLQHADNDVAAEYVDVPGCSSLR